VTETVSDFVVVGAGQNTLSAAAYLAAAGFSVTVLERHKYYGGGCITHEVTAPGFRHDIHATNVYMARANPLVSRDELGLVARFGLRYADSDQPSHGTVFEDGSAIALHRDLERSCESIARYSPSDADAYRQFIRSIMKYIPLFSFALFCPPSDGKRFTALLAESPEGRFLLDLLNKSVLDIVTELFTEERTKVHVLRLASEMMMRPDSTGTGFGLMFQAGLYHTHPPGFVIGGSQGFADALVGCIEHHGGRVLTDAEVDKIDVKHGRAVSVRTTDGRQYGARKAIVAGLPPWRLSDFVEGTEALTEKVSRVPTSDFTCFLTHLALNEAPKSVAGPEFQRMGFTTVAPVDLAAMLRMTRQAAEGHVPSDFSACYVCATNCDPTRAPEGKATLYLYRPVPTLLRGRPLDQWDEWQKAVGDDLIAQTRRYVPNLTPDNIIGCMHESPCDIQRESPSYLNGDVAGLAMTPDQFFGGRPIPELANYRVPGVEGLYLCGPFMHPGGGANGGGRPVAMRIMMDLGMNLTSVFQI